jgi:hypothetical protein
MDILCQPCNIYKTKQVCNEENCNKKALFNFKNKTIPIFCGIHKEIAMSNILKTLCEDKNCISEAFYNTIGESKPLFCRKHKKNEMQNIIKKLCQHPNCKKIPVFGYTTNNKKLYCVQHKLETMENLDCKKCQEYGCLKLASFNYEGQKYGIYCEEHKKENMKNVRKHKCIEERCVRQANYNLKNKQPMWCRIHKTSLMINVTNKLCEHPSCEKVPSFNYINKKKSILCSEHKLPGMINVAGKICKTPFCTITTRNNKNDKYRGYCFFCFIHTFPDEKVARNYKTKEKSVTDCVKTKFHNYSWIIDKPIDGGCSKKRPDMFLDFGSHVLIIEVDENQHNNTLCENKRLVILSQDISHRPLVIIRFNPDSYKIGQTNVTSCWSTTNLGIHTVKRSKQKEWKERLECLYTQIEYWINNIPDKTIENVYLFYNS